MSVLKTFNIALDTKKALYGDRITLVESDTGNRFVITLTDDGDPVNLTGCRVAVVFSGAMGTAMQTSWSGTGQVTIGGDDDNEITVDVLPASYANGLVTCEIQVYSGESYTTLVTSAAFTFNGRKPIVDENTLDSSTEYPILVELINQVEGLTTREQSDWEQTDGTQGNYIQNKPVVGTDIQQNTNGLTAETTLADDDTFPFYDLSETAHRKSTWANIVAKIRTALFGSITGLLKLDGAGNASAGVANTDYAAATHASRHSVGGTDALTGYEKERLSFADQTVTTSGWATYTAIGTEETKIFNKNYIYRKSLTLSGVLSTMRALVIKSADLDDCGASIFPTVITYDGGIYLYATSVPTAAFTLLSVDCLKAVG